MWASAAAAAVAAAVVVGIVIPKRTAVDDMKSVVQASQPLGYRPSVARFSADFPYQEPRHTYRGNGSESAPSDGRELQMLTAASQIQEKGGKSPSASQLHALGVAFVWLGQTEAGQTEAGVSHLENALRSESKRQEISDAIRLSQNAALLNDLAAAYVTLLTTKKGPNDDELQALALAAVNRAWELQKTPQIAWTRAVVIGRFHVREKTIAAWQDYLKLDHGSEWATEARKLLDDAQRPTDVERWPSIRNQLSASKAIDANLLQLADPFREDLRLWCEDELLPQWGAAMLRGDSSAADQLRKIGDLAGALQRLSGEREVAGAVDAIRNASPSSLSQLAAGHVAYGAGRIAQEASKPAVALQQMDLAANALTPGLTPFVWRVRTERAAALYRLSQYPQALAELNSLLNDKGAVLSNSCKGKIHALIGVIHLQRSSYKDAADEYRQAIDGYRRAGERDYEATLISRLAGALESAGEQEEARAYRIEALQALDRIGNAKHRHDVMIETAYVAIGKNQEAVAGLYLDALVANGIRARDNVLACTSLMWRSAYQYHLGIREAAVDDLANAERTCRAVSDSADREGQLANLDLAHAALSTDVSSPSIGGLDAAVQYYEKTDKHVWLRTAYFTRARMLAARGDGAAAERDFTAAMIETDKTREKIDVPRMRTSFTATADEITDGYVEFLLQQQRPQEAFEIADRNRCRELTDSPAARWQSESVGSLLRRVQAALPPATAIIEYRLLDKNIVAWVVTADALNVVTLPVSIESIKEALAALGSATQQQLQERAALLYDGLLRPIESSLTHATNLIVVPDDELERVPYSALYDRANGSYVVQAHGTVVAPSASLFVQSAMRSDERSNGNEQLLVIAAASGSENFAPIPEAKSEAQAIAALYPNARIIDGSDQAGDAVLADAGKASLLQFAGHTTMAVDSSSPVLRLGEQKTARLGMADILAAHMPKLRLVYLSACETDNGPIMKSEGSVTIARSFFAAGVPVVVATLWPVDDTSARLVAQSFHQRLRAGDAPAEALRRAQLGLLLREPPSRVDWAAFRVIGSGI
jgi:CHAT domain-containing protein